jgi:hypothetical protein
VSSHLHCEPTAADTGAGRRRYRRRDVYRLTGAPTRRNRLWQADVSEFETLGAGTWNLGGVVDYVAEVLRRADKMQVKAQGRSVDAVDGGPRRDTARAVRRPKASGFIGATSAAI